MIFNRFRAYLLVIFSFFASIQVGLTQKDTLKFTKDECETLFLQNNLSLLAENLNISKAEAEILQAKAWPNPSISIEEVNLWRPKSIQNEELIPPLAGKFGRNQQFAIGFEQLIITAGKRKKLIDYKKVEAEQAGYYFEEVLRGLKYEFRELLNELNYLQAYEDIIQHQLNSIQQLLKAYKNQVDQGFLNKSEYIRLKALSFELHNTGNQIANEKSEVEQEIKLLMNISLNNTLVLEDVNMKINRNQLPLLDYQSLAKIARDNRPEMHIAQMDEELAYKQLKIEKAERAPDFSILGEYNRGDGIYQDFVGFGVSFDLPVFSRNKGNIKIADLEIQQAQLNKEFLHKSIEKELNLALLQWERAFNFRELINDEYEEELDLMLEAYIQNFKNKNIGMIEFLDFLEAYLENKDILLQAEKELRSKAENINFTVGKDLIK